MDLPEKYIYEIEAAIEQWTDRRLLSERELETLLWFWLYVPRVLSQNGWSYKGAVFRQSDDQTLLTVKAKENGTPLVVFVTSATAIGSMDRFLSLLEEDRLGWRRDKYPWT